MCAALYVVIFVLVLVSQVDIMQSAPSPVNVVMSGEASTASGEANAAGGHTDVKYARALQLRIRVRLRGGNYCTVYCF